MLLGSGFEVLGSGFEVLLGSGFEVLPGSGVEEVLLGSGFEEVCGSGVEEALSGSRRGRLECGCLVRPGLERKKTSSIVSRRSVNTEHVTSLKLRLYESPEVTLCG